MRRVLFSLIFVGIVSAAFSTTSCGSPGYRCEGKPRKCSNLPPSRCSAEVGCPAAAKPVCVRIGYGCAVSDFDGIPCPGLTCEVDANQRCNTVCAGLLDEAACTAKGGACEWLNGTCTTSCEVIGDADTCEQTPNCDWLACSGKPLACEEFSGDSCPTWLGCDKIEGHAYSAQ